jgi:hypothetical protein
MTLTAIGKVGYLAAYMGLTLLVIAVVQMLFPGSRLNVALVLIPIALILVGVIVLAQDPYARNLRWRLLWTQVWSSPKEKVGFVLVFFGTSMLWYSASIWSGWGLEYWWQYLTISLASLIIGLGLILADIRK